MATAIKIAPTASTITAAEILENIQDMPCPYMASSMHDPANPGVRVVIPAERSLDADIKAMMSERGLSPRHVDAVYQHATATWLEVSGRTDTEGMTAQLIIAEGMCDLFLAAYKMR